MPDQREWLLEICRSPGDDAPRLACADWLTARNDPRGEFIRIQCQLAQLPVEDPRYWQLDQQAQTLLTEHQAKWLGELTGRVSEWTFERGFLSSITVDGGRYLASTDRRVCFRSPLDADRTRQLVQILPPTIEKLHLPGNHLGCEGLRAVVAAEHLVLLKDLDVSGFQPASKATDWDPYEANVGAEGARLLADSAWSTRLVRLNLALNQLDDATVEALAASPHLQNLHLLRIHESEDEPYIQRQPPLGKAAIEQLRAAFSNRLVLSLQCPTGTFARELVRRPDGAVSLGGAPRC